MAEMPRYAHLMILLLMGAEVSVALAFLAAVGGAVARRKLVTLLAAGAALFIATGYACVLLVVGWISPEKILAPGERKYFCEADCHIAYSIESVQDIDSSGLAQQPLAPATEWIEIRLKTWFDPDTIAPFRGDAPLNPPPRAVVLVDAGGRRFLPLLNTAAAPGSSSMPLAQPLRPGEGYNTRLLFEVPHDARDLRLLITDVDPASRFIIDHENSPLHGKVLLRLPAQRSAALSVSPRTQ